MQTKPGGLTVHKTYTAEQLKKEFSGLFVDAKPDHYEKKGRKWFLMYQVLGYSKRLEGVYKPPEKCIIG
jgi:hypothetical protein